MEEKWNKETKNEKIITRTVAENFHIRTVHLDNTRWFKYDRDWCRQIYTQVVPVIFEPPCVKALFIHQLIH